MPYNLLIADDDPVSIGTYQYALRNEDGIKASYVKDGFEAVQTYRANPDHFALVILDYDMPKLTGAEAAAEIFKFDPGAYIVVNSGVSSREALLESLKVRVFDFIDKANPDELMKTIHTYCTLFDKKRRIAKTDESNIGSRELISKLNMIGSSSQMAKVASLAIKVSQTNSSILIKGETGTGKELVARAIHDMSNRKRSNFVAINCGAIPEGLIEAELFGAEKGSYTGSTAKRIGKFEIANGGTIFLDEIGDMPQKAQVKLLRVLQEGTFEPIGSNETKKTDVRILAASHVNLQEAITNGNFREDLYYRLNVVPIEIPRLADRPDDIEPLTLHFLNKHGAQNPKQILASAIDALKSFDWPGNVRQLENKIQMLLSLVVEDTIGPKDVFSVLEIDSFNSAFNCRHDEFVSKLNNEREAKEKAFLVHNLMKSKSIRDAAERLLGVPNSTLAKRLKDLEINFKELVKR